MNDIDDASLTEDVYRKLTDEAFRRCLKATDGEGTHPITIARKEETLHRVMDRVRTAGGTSNVVVPVAGGYAVIAITMNPRDTDSTSAMPESIRDDCTLGVFMSRMTQDGAQHRTRDYVIVTPDGRTELERGSAEMTTTSV